MGHFVQGTTGIPLDAETNVAERIADHESELRLRLRLLFCATLIGGKIRCRLRHEFDVTWPRFEPTSPNDR
jgi:hypothetical protein